MSSVLNVFLVLLYGFFLFFFPPFFLFSLDFLLRKHFIFSTSFLFIYFPFLYLFDLFSGKFLCLYRPLSTKLSFWQSYSYFIAALSCFGFSFSVSFIYFCFHLYDTVSSTNLSFVCSSASFKCKVAFRLLTLEFVFFPLMFYSLFSSPSPSENNLVMI